MATVTEDAARKTANVLMGAAAIGIAYYVIRTPPLRRLAWRLASTALTISLPTWLGKEISQAWAESER
jgi:hypothetical protein